MKDRLYKTFQHIQNNVAILHRRYLNKPFVKRVIHLKIPSAVKHSIIFCCQYGIYVFTEIFPKKRKYPQMLLFNPIYGVNK